MSAQNHGSYAYGDHEDPGAAVPGGRTATGTMVAPMKQNSGMPVNHFPSRLPNDNDTDGRNCTSSQALPATPGHEFG